MENPSRHWRNLLLLSGVAVFFCAINWFVIWIYYNDWNKGAAFGNSFGLVNTIFSGLAFAALISTILLQQESLRLAHDDLKHAAKARKDSEDEMVRTLEQSRKGVEAEMLLKVLDMYRDSRRRHLEYSGPELLKSWDEFKERYTTERDRRRSHEWVYLSDVGGIFEFCGMCLELGYISEDLVKFLPRSYGLWGKYIQIIQGMRGELGDKAIWGNWEKFAKRQENLTRSFF